MAVTDAPSCACEEWASGGLHLNIERSAADGRVLSLEAPSGFPKRTAVSAKFADRLSKAVPGAAQWKDDRLVIRTTRHQHAYRRRGHCAPCKLILIEYEGRA